jgi:hypothetical protein
MALLGHVKGKGNQPTHSGNHSRAEGFDPFLLMDQVRETTGSLAQLSDGSELLFGTKRA